MMLASKQLQQGIVLVTALLFLLLLTVLSMSSLETGLLELKMSRNWHDTSRYLQAAESALRKGELALTTDDYAICAFLKPQSANFFLEKSMTWWQFNGCVEKLFDSDMYYVIEKLIKDSCGYVNDDPAVTSPGIEYYRVTARVNNPAEQDSYPVLLQITYVKASPAICTGSLHPVNAGRQSWRQLLT